MTITKEKTTRSGTEDKTKGKSHEIKGKEEVGKLTWEGEAIETYSPSSGLSPAERTSNVSL